MQRAFDRHFQALRRANLVSILIRVKAQLLRSTTRSIWPSIKVLDNRLGVMERTPS
jgi:hypothetical protein